MREFKPFQRALKIGLWGETKEGKSHMAASFVKSFDGMVLDFAKIAQEGGWSGATPSYNVTQVGAGEAIYAAENVGLDVEKQYRFIRNWDELMFALEEAREYRDKISKKPNQRIWLVFDDTRWYRYQVAQHVAQEAKHKMITKDDWKANTSKLVVQITQLEAEFNLLYVNQAGSEYAGGEATGERSGAFYPAGAQFIYDLVLQIWTDKTVKPWKQHATIEAQRSTWGGYADSISDIINPTPQTILEAAKIRKELW